MFIKVDVRIKPPIWTKIGSASGFRSADKDLKSLDPVRVIFIPFVTLSISTKLFC